MPGAVDVIGVLVIAPDGTTARARAERAGRAPGFQVVGTADSAAGARAALAERSADLLLLDTDLPGESGLDLLASVDVDTIMVTACPDAATVRTALARGALNYLVEPFSADQLKDRLAAYARYRGVVHAPGRHLTQAEIDRAVRLRHAGDRPGGRTGSSPATAGLVSGALRRDGRPRSAADIATELGISRATAQRYLTVLAESGSACRTLRYGATGRPEHLYHWAG